MAAANRNSISRMRALCRHGSWKGFQLRSHPVSGLDVGTTVEKMLQRVLVASRGGLVARGATPLRMELSDHRRQSSAPSPSPGPPPTRPRPALPDAPSQPGATHQACRPARSRPHPPRSCPLASSRAPQQRDRPPRDRFRPSPRPRDALSPALPQRATLEWRQFQTARAPATRAGDRRHAAPSPRRWPRCWHHGRGAAAPHSFAPPPLPDGKAQDPTTSRTVTPAISAT